jgi:hypothetical protein
MSGSDGTDSSTQEMSVILIAYWLAISEEMPLKSILPLS